MRTTPDTFVFLVEISSTLEALRAINHSAGGEAQYEGQGTVPNTLDSSFIISIKRTPAHHIRGIWTVPPQNRSTASRRLGA